MLIAAKLWRYRWVTLPISLLVLAGACYVFVVQKPTYEAGATYILVSPPAPPTDAEIAANPALGKIHADNPYLRFSSQTVVVQILASRLNSEQGRRTLAQHGADPNYLAEPSPEFGFSAPILQVTGTGTTPAAAIGTANLVGLTATRELDRMQQERGVDKKYRIGVEAIVPAHQATLKASGKLRSLVAVFALGTILMFITISVLDAVNAFRTRWGEPNLLQETEDADAETSLLGPLTLAPEQSFPDPDEKGSQWLEARR